MFASTTVVQTKHASGTSKTNVTCIVFAHHFSSPFAMFIYQLFIKVET
jgi:hypothetical protein